MSARRSVRPRSTPPLVSVITPTRDRGAFLPGLIKVFAQQTYPRLELLIFDDSTEPCRLPRHRNVTYLHSSQQLSPGAARNQLVQAARGEILVHFDDDDYYAPNYVTRMVEELGDRDLVKLSGWFAYHAPTEQFFYWQTDRIGAVHYIVAPNASVEAFAGTACAPHFVDQNLYGFGFSYVYRRSAAVDFPYPDIRFGEDRAFVLALQLAGQSIGLVEDAEGLALHVIHSSNGSRAFPQYLLPKALAQRFFAPGVVGDTPKAGSVETRHPPSPARGRSKGRTR